MKTDEDKGRLLDALRENHIALAACRKTGIGKSTYYRWRQEDPTFAEEADAAIREGVEMVNDAAESNIVTAIKNRDQEASRFWLKHRHGAYSTKIKVETTKPDTELSPEQEAIVRKALELAALGDAEEVTQKIDHHHEQQNDNGTGIEGADHQGPEGASRSDAR